MCAQISLETAAGVRLHAGIVNGYREFARRFASVETKVDTMSSQMSDVISRLERLEQTTERRRQG
jgi:outer membrane murein-binding lipoprotein Lpp